MMPFLIEKIKSASICAICGKKSYICGLKIIKSMYDVFISYSRKDYYDEERKCVIEGNIVSKIIELFGDNKITYWFDKDGIYSGDKFPEVITKAIKESKLFLFLATENSNASDWTSMEISTAHFLKKKIIPFRVDESIYADSVLLYMSRLDHIEYFQDENVAFKSLINSIKNYLEELDKKDKEAKSKNQKAEKIADLRSEIVRLKNLQDSLESDIKKTMASIREDKKTYNERVKKIEEAEDELYMLQHGSKREHKPINLYFDDEDKLKVRIKQLENQIVALNEEKKSLQSKIDVLEKNEEDYKKRNENISEKLKNLEKEIEELRKQLAFSNKERDNLKIQFAGAGTELEHLKNENAKCKKDLDLERSRRAELEKKIEKYEKEKKIAEEKTKIQNKTIMCKGIPIEMIAVKGGTFTMGATSEQGSDAYDDEKPAHSVTLSDYYIGKFEVTQELWQAVMGNNPSNFKGNKNPVEQVSWNDCQDFIRKLNQLTGANFRLPTEAEWEYAARGGNKSKGYKYSGSNSISDVAWYTDNSGSKTHTVGTKSPNELGIYDMSGNVWEWCQDWYGDYGSGSQTNPEGASSGFSRVFRGGSWLNSARNCRVSYRNYVTPDYRNDNLGFRLAVSQ